MICAVSELRFAVFIFRKNLVLELWIRSEKHTFEQGHSFS